MVEDTCTLTGCEIMRILNNIAIFGGLDEAQLNTVISILEKASYRAGDLVFKEGASPSHIYIVESGKVKMIADVDGEAFELIEFGVGKCFGETSVIGIVPHSATALVEEDTELLLLSATALHHIYTTDKGLFSLLILNIAREACRRLFATDKTLLHYARHTQEKK